MKLIDIYDADKAGYTPFLIGERWQAAFLNYAPEEALESIVKLDVHHRTDEVFVLLDGRAALIAARIGGGRIDFEAVAMEPLRAYNIRRGCGTRSPCCPAAGHLSWRTATRTSVISNSTTSPPNRSPRCARRCERS